MFPSIIYIYIYVYIHMYTYTHIYIYRERERKRERGMYLLVWFLYLLRRGDPARHGIKWS